MKTALEVVRGFIDTTLEGSDARREAARDAFDAIEAQLDTAERQRADLVEWANSLHDLRSDKLSSVGIDDLGDLVDEVPAFGDWMGRFWTLAVEERTFDEIDEGFNFDLDAQIRDVDFNLDEAGE